ncbi:SDR family oxidoreductase [Bradyrhizobium sp. CIAT3101]|uniref:SDR family oxidoreductase n=1 Tax=Bradyrhizobium sp. CIAT3101 TaxID=439387 RepID=UPI0024B10812|nr:SDR family oxidoreductase [Bradyrhizobium sp. CIAT3101]WFU80517.1 SDR family oxidoreductase [Bradyrhizobium sp. CIAT3101]
MAAFDLRGSTIGYAAIKAGVVNLTKNLARALSPEVRVNAVSPGFINSTWMLWPEETLRAGVEKPLLKRSAEPADIEEVIVYLGFGPRWLRAPPRGTSTQIKFTRVSALG